MISMMKRAALVLVALLAIGAVTAPTFAQDEISPEHLALARKYIDLTDQGGVYEVSLIETAIESMKLIVQQNPQLSQQTDDAITKTLDAYRLRKGELMDQFARVYALAFTPEELQEIVKFYESPIGRKLASSNLSLNQSLQRVMTAFQINLKTEFLAKVRAELKAAGFDV